MLTCQICGLRGADVQLPGGAHSCDPCAEFIRSTLELMQAVGVDAFLRTMRGVEIAAEDTAHLLTEPPPGGNHDE